MIDEQKILNQQYVQTLKTFFPTVAKEFQDEGIEKGIEQERERIILHFYNQMGFTAEQISNATAYPIELVQNVIGKTTRHDD